MSKSFMLDGLPIKEARKPIKLLPTEQDIKKAKRKDPTCCVAATAFKRMKNVKRVHVYRSRTYVQFKGDPFWTRYKTPVRLAANTVTYDKAGIFDLEDYTFPPLQPTQRGQARVERIASGEEKRSNKVRNGTRPRRRISPMANVRGAASLVSV
jgi:hypothetical protein